MPRWWKHNSLYYKVNYVDHCVPKINCKCASLCMAPRSSGIQYLQKHEFNLPLAVSGVFYIYGFYCSPPGQECQFASQSGLSFLLKKGSTPWCGLFFVSHELQWAAVAGVTLVCHNLWDLAVLAYYFSNLLAMWALFIFTYEHWKAFREFIQLSIFVMHIQNLTFSAYSTFVFEYLCHWEPWTAAKGHTNIFSILYFICL